MSGVDDRPHGVFLLSADDSDEFRAMVDRFRAELSETIDRHAGVLFMPREAVVSLVEPLPPNPESDQRWQR